MIKSILLAVFFTLPVFLFAHSPSSINLKYEKENDKEILKIDISHSVRNVERHYIESITIKVNGDEVEVLEYSKQKTESDHNVTVEMPGLQKGDVVEVEANCSRIGSRSAELKIE